MCIFGIVWGFRYLLGHVIRRQVRETPLLLMPEARGCAGHDEWCEGNFQDYEEDKKRRLGDNSVLPKRRAGLQRLAATLKATLN